MGLEERTRMCSSNWKSAVFSDSGTANATDDSHAWVTITCKNEPRNEEELGASHVMSLLCN